ncbi:MAG TPA: type II secretion system protein GspM [Rhizomicrobium sp.]|jgi:general secretion pathway protein M
MTTPQSWKTRQGALVAAGVIGGLALAVLVLLGFLIFGGQSADTDAAVRQLAFYRAEVALKPQLEAQLANLKQQAAATPGLIGNESAALAQAQLQDEVKALVIQNGGEVRTAQIVPVSTTNGFQVIAIQYDIMAPMAKLRDLVHAIESHTPYLFIDEADIVSTQDYQSGDPASANPTLELRWTVHGYRWGGK